MYWGTCTRHTQKPFPAKAFLFLPGFNLKQLFRLFIGHLFWFLEAKFLYCRLLGINASNGMIAFRTEPKVSAQRLGWTLRECSILFHLISWFGMRQSPFWSNVSPSLEGRCSVLSHPESRKWAQHGPASCGTALPSFLQIAPASVLHGVRVAWHRTHCKNGQDLSPNTTIPTQFAPNLHV